LPEVICRGIHQSVGLVTMNNRLTSGAL